LGANPQFSTKIITGKVNNSLHLSLKDRIQDFHELIIS
jgi:hypothetical protein